VGFQGRVGGDDRRGLLSGLGDDLLVLDDGEHPQRGADAGLRLPEHVATLAEHGIEAFDLVVVNLYPFAATVASGAGQDECVELTPTHVRIRKVVLNQSERARAAKARRSGR